MQKKLVIFGSIAVLAVAATSLFFWRAVIMGPGARMTAGGLAVVSPSGEPVSVPVTGETLPENVAVARVDDLVVRLEIDPYPPRMSRATNFKISLIDAGGAPVEGAAVSLDLTMPGMYMPPNKPEFIPEGQGIYTASGHFTMRGLWYMEAIVTLNGITRSVFFQVWL